MNILGFIPAREGSKGIPKKNIYPVAGKPLIAYTIEAAQASRINRIFVSTNSPEIARCCKNLGVDVPFLRPESISGDETIIEEAISDTLEKLERQEAYKPDIIVLLQPTAPLRTAEDIDNCIDLLVKEKVDTVVSVSEPIEHPGDAVYWENPMTMKFLLNSNSINRQRQQYPESYFLNGLVYAFTYASFCRTNSRYGKSVRPYLTPQARSFDIDSMDVLKVAEAMLEKDSRILNKSH